MPSICFAQHTYSTLHTHTSFMYLFTYLTRYEYVVHNFFNIKFGNNFTHTLPMYVHAHLYHFATISLMGELFSVSAVPKELLFLIWTETTNAGRISEYIIQQFYSNNWAQWQATASSRSCATGAAAAATKADETEAVAEVVPYSVSTSFSCWRIAFHGVGW